MHRVSVVIPVFNGGTYLPNFFQSLVAALPDHAQVVLIDDGSTEQVFEMLPDFPQAKEVIRIRNERNLGYSCAVNRAFGCCTEDFVVQLNTDLVLAPSCITSMVELAASRTDAGIIGSKLIFPTTGLVQHIGMAFGLHTKKHVYFQLREDHPLCRKTRPMQIVTGATVAMTRQVLDKLGPLDERYFNYDEDIDHCMKAASLGLVNFTCAESIAYHWTSQSGPARFARMREADALFWSKWHSQIAVDLTGFVNEAISHFLSTSPNSADMHFDAINLCKSPDDKILIDCLENYWPAAMQNIRQCGQSNNPSNKYWLPMLLPHWVRDNPRPFIYLVDHFYDLDENRLWFSDRLAIVEDEIVVDTTGCVVSVSEMLS